MRIPPSLMTRGFGVVVMASMVACGGNSGGGVDAGDPPGAIDADPDAPDADPNAPDANPEPPVSGICSEGGRATSNRYLPDDVGNSWSYRVDEFDGNPPVIKRQRYSEIITPDEETGPVIVQLTENASGNTENWLQRQGDKMVRLRQRDFDSTGRLERTTSYLPYRLRLDESPERLVAGARWTENYVRVVEDSLGTTEETISEEWSIIGVDVACPEPWSHVKCLQVGLDRIQGGVSQKTYWFARSYGKILEEGGLLEELFDCDLK
jgi:hypothetical protein